MNRREFLQLISATAAALTLADVAALVPAPSAAIPVPWPAVNWAAWNRIEVELDDDRGPLWSINGVCVNADPALVQKVSRLISLTTGETQAAALRLGIARDGYARFGYRETLERDRDGDPRPVAWYDYEGIIVVGALAS
jgi:hypothetical protein